MNAAIQNYAIAASNWRHMMWLAVGQLLNRYAGPNKVAFIFTFAEPLLVIVGLYIFRGLFKQNTPNYGTSLFLFYASGFLPFYLFFRVSSRARSSATGPRTRLPGLTALDMYMATVVLQSLIWIAALVGVFVGMWLYGIKEARPASMVTCAIPVLLLIVLAAGIGMINNVIIRFVPVWAWIYNVATRGLVILSGVMIVVDLTPPWMRAYAILNPLSHAVEWFRLGVYGRYPHNSLDKAYLVEWAVIALFVGFVLDRAALRHLDDR
jgi:capsular polysaccharide transport system permease protein